MTESSFVHTVLVERITKNAVADGKHKEKKMKTYEAPEIFELGEAAHLTKGLCNVCVPDSPSTGGKKGPGGEIDI